MGEGFEGMKSHVWMGILRKQDPEKSLKDGTYKCDEKLLRERREFGIKNDQTQAEKIAQLVMCLQV